MRYKPTRTKRLGEKTTVDVSQFGEDGKLMVPAWQSRQSEKIRVYTEKPTKSQPVLTVEPQGRIRDWRPEVLHKTGMRGELKLGGLVRSPPRYCPIAQSSRTNLSLPPAGDKKWNKQPLGLRKPGKAEGTVRCCTEHREMRWDSAYWVVRPPAILMYPTPKQNSGEIPSWRHWEAQKIHRERQEFPNKMA